MNKKELMENVTRSFNMTKLKVKKYSPEIFLGVGIVGTVTATVLACKATINVKDILDEYGELRTQIDNGAMMAEAIGKTYTEEDKANDIRVAKVQTGVKIAKNYAVPAVISLASIGCLVYSHNILSKRNAAIAAAYAAVSQSYKKYRERVVERFGEDVDYELKYGVKPMEVEKVTTDENGNEVVEKETVMVATDPYNEYSRIFDDGCDSGWVRWSKDPEENKNQLFIAQSHLNDVLKSKGHLFLNEAYEYLGFPYTKAGQSIGWIYDREKGPHVDFGIFNTDVDANIRFVNGIEPTIIINFNVDGDILDMI